MFMKMCMIRLRKGTYKTYTSKQHHTVQIEPLSTSPLETLYGTWPPSAALKNLCSYSFSRTAKSQILFFALSVQISEISVICVKVFQRSSALISGKKTSCQCYGDQLHPPHSSLASPIPSTESKNFALGFRIILDIVIFLLYYCFLSAMAGVSTIQVIGSEVFVCLDAHFYSMGRRNSKLALTALTICKSA